MEWKLRASDRLAVAYRTGASLVPTYPYPTNLPVKGNYNWTSEATLTRKAHSRDTYYLPIKCPQVADA
jgi:hypothetical protein